MKTLTLHLDYAAHRALKCGEDDLDLVLPVQVVDGEGEILAEGVTGLSQPARVEVPDVAWALACLIWPSGRAFVQRVDLLDQMRAEVHFSDTSIATDTWSTWAIPRLNPRTPLMGEAVPKQRALGRFARVWLRLWRKTQDGWQQQPLHPQAIRSNDIACQFDLDLDHAVWLLQVGGSQVPWRFVALPGGARARIFLTPTDSSDPRSEPLKVVVTGFHGSAEILLEFIARDALRAADILVRSVPLADHLFSHTEDDPISAVAGAYYRLKRGGWQDLPPPWWERLSQQFPWLPDAALLHCIRLLREGVDASTQESAQELLTRSLAQGWPLYQQGLALLQEAAAGLRLPRAVQADIRALVAAKSWAGAATSFYGRFPDAPMALRWVGMPSTPRRRRLDPALKGWSSAVKSDARPLPGEDFLVRDLLS